MARLTIPDEQTFAEFTVVTSTTAFPITFNLFAKADLTVKIDGTALDQSAFTFTGTLLQGGGYDGGTVTLNEAVDDVTVRIERNVTPARTSNFAPSANTPVGNIDQALNRATAILQDHSRRIDTIADGIVEEVLDELPVILEGLDLRRPFGGLWLHDYALNDAGIADGNLPMFIRAKAAGLAAEKPVYMLPGAYPLSGTPETINGLLAHETTGRVDFRCATGKAVISSASATGRALFYGSGGGEAHFDGIVFDATNVTSNFGIKLEGFGDFSFGDMGVIGKGFRRVGTNGAFNGDTLEVTSIQGHGCSSGSATGEAFGYCNGGGYVNRVIATDVTGSGFNWSATKVIGGHLRVGLLICRWTKWPDGVAYPTRYAALRLGNGTSNITFGYVFAEGVYRGVRLTDTDNCWVNQFTFKNLIGPAILFNRKDQRARNSGVLNVTGVGPCRGNLRNDLGVSDKDSELIPGEGDVAAVIQEGEGWTLGKTTVSCDENSPGSGLITASTASATVTNKDTDFVGQDFNCFKDVVVGDLLFTAAGVVLGKVLSKGARTYWTDAGGTISQPAAAGANHATQSLTLTGLSAATVSAVAYEQRTPDDYFYVANTGNITIVSDAITNNSVAAGAGTITCATTSATVTGVGTAFSTALIGQSLFKTDNTVIGQIADIDETLPTTVLRLAANAAVALAPGSSYKIGWDFTKQFGAGDLIFDASLNYAGVVATVSAMSATLTAPTLAPAVTNAAFRYGKLYKVRIGLEVAESATETNVNLDDVLFLGATTQHKVNQPQGIKAAPAQTITKDQLATVSAVGQVGVRRYVSNLTIPGWMYSDNVDWVKENKSGLTSFAGTADFTHVYRDTAPVTRLVGTIAGDKIITVSETNLPHGEEMSWSHRGSGGNWIFKTSGGTTLMTLCPGQFGSLIYDKTVTTFRNGGIMWSGPSAPNILSGTGSPEGAVAASVGSTFQRTDGGAGTCFYVKESGTGNTGWVAK